MTTEIDVTIHDRAVMAQVRPADPLICDRCRSVIQGEARWVRGEIVDRKCAGYAEWIEARPYVRPAEEPEAVTPRQRERRAVGKQAPLGDAIGAWMRKNMPEPQARRVEVKPREAPKTTRPPAEVRLAAQRERATLARAAKATRPKRDPATVKTKGEPGQTFPGSRLTSVRFLGDRLWLWRCACGAEVRATWRDVRSGHTKSCGCLRREINQQRCAEWNAAAVSPATRAGVERAGAIVSVAGDVSYREMAPETRAALANMARAAIEAMEAKA